MSAALSYSIPTISPSTADRGWPTAATPPALSARERKLDRLAHLFESYRMTHQPEVRDEIVGEYTPLVSHLAYKFTSPGECAKDLSQVGLIGLLNAIERFDVNLGANFRTYACATIIGEMKRYMRDKTWAIKVPRRLLELRATVHRALDRLTTDLGRPPRPIDVALLTGLPAEDVVEVLEMEQCRAPKSIDAPAQADSGARNSPLADTLRATDNTFDEVDRRMILRLAFQHVTPAEQLVLVLRFYSGLTQVEIAERVHTSQMQVSRILRRALDRMKTVLLKGGQACSF